jgi:hypothetical protein
MKLTKTERKILVYNKMKLKGLSHDEAYKEVESEIKHLKEMKKK